MTIADRIRNRRLELGLSVDDLANRLQKNRATVYRYESNYIKSYSPELMKSLAEALETTPAYLYGYDESDSLDDNELPKNDDVRLLIRGFNQFTPEEIEQAKAMMKIMFSKHAKYFEEENDDDA